MKNYIADMERLEVGGHLMSEHLTWLLRMAMFLTVDKNNDAINSVVYTKDLPKTMGEKVTQGIWGTFFPAGRTIVMNMQQHLSAVLLHIQDKKHMNNSIRALLLRELLDTAAHEAWHARKCLETGSWDEEELDEDGAKDNAWIMSWGMAEHWDVNVEQFGPFFDAFLQEMYKDLKEDVQEDDCKEWKKVQFHMLDNNINYYNPESGVEIRTIREVFQAQIRPEVAWIDADNPLFTSFSPVKSIAQRIAEDETNHIAKLPDTNILSPAPVKETPSTPVPAAKFDDKTITPHTPATEQQVTTQQTTTVCADYDPLGDSACDMDNPFDDDVATPEMVMQTNVAPVMDNTTIPVEVAGAAAAPAVDGTVGVQQPVVPQMDVLRIQQIAEQVLRRMFHHVSTKCEFNINGGYNNTNAVLDPINISDIDGASDLFAKQDTLDANGVFQSHTDVNGFVKGLPTAGGLPRYTFYMNMGGKLHKRVFIAQNPDKKKVDGITPTAFASKVQAGNRIMMLLADGAGITADITLPTGSILGQEIFKIWDKK